MKIKLNNLEKVSPSKFMYQNKGTRLGYGFVLDFILETGTIKVNRLMNGTNTKIIGWQDKGIDEKLMLNRDNYFVVLCYNDEDGEFWEHGLPYDSQEDLDELFVEIGTEND